MSKKIGVRLNSMNTSLEDINTSVLAIAEAILKYCGVYSVWDDPKGGRVFYVTEKPDDFPQAGIYWTVDEDFKMFENHKPLG